MRHQGSVADEVQATDLTAEAPLVLLFVDVLMSLEGLVG